jgi:hypothetical protein
MNISNPSPPVCVPGCEFANLLVVVTGRISEQDVIAQIFVLLAAGLGTGYALDVWAGHETPIIFYLSIFGSFISYIYSAPPLKLKQWGWAGNYALGSSYIALPWWAGQVSHITHGVHACMAYGRMGVRKHGCTEGCTACLPMPCTGPIAHVLHGQFAQTCSNCWVR